MDGTVESPRKQIYDVRGRVSEYTPEVSSDKADQRSLSISSFGSEFVSRTRMDRNGGPPSISAIITTSYAVNHDRNH
ncbi:hypothetical protein BDM02DRAFT_3113239 [Thelephora ganbajun]|uniref:Uncharacterized protein n=1 Tax=Thelephora ganbajun TaxID=370292 RepID=A0ACB6ZJL0_THEGA|nr:hypothetical protein BDM02DRAFT_3113239 [Thelephora ganbajun]